MTKGIVKREPKMLRGLCPLCGKQLVLWGTVLVGCNGKPGHKFRIDWNPDVPLGDEYDRLLVLAAPSDGLNIGDAWQLPNIVGFQERLK